MKPSRLRASMKPQRSDTYFTDVELDALAGALYAASGEGAVGVEALSAVAKIEIEANAREIRTFSMPWGHGGRTPGEWRRSIEQEVGMSA